MNYTELYSIGTKIEENDIYDGDIYLWHEEYWICNTGFYLRKEHSNLNRYTGETKTIMIADFEDIEKYNRLYFINQIGLSIEGYTSLLEYYKNRKKKKIPLKEYAEAHNIDPATARQRAIRGAYQTAEKIGRDWFIDADEQHQDNRIKSGEFKNWRNKTTS